MAREAAKSVKRSSLSKLNTPVHTSLDTSVHAYVDTPKRKTGFGQTPKDVMKRPDLSSDAKLIFAAVNMQSPGKESVAVSLRDLESCVPFKKSKIGNLLRKLIKVRLLIPEQRIKGQVMIYRINHANWTVAVEKSKKCPRCGSSAFSLGASGSCSNCIAELRAKLA